MFRILLLLALVGVVVWMITARRREPPAPPPADLPKSPGAPQAMLACGHCGVHLPRDEALCDAQGRAFCSEAHRLAGPR